MDVQGLHPYQQGVDSVFKYFSDSDTIKTKYAAVGARNIEVLECREDGGALTVKIQREVPSDVPGLLKKFLGAWNKVIQTETWQQDGGVRTCKMDINIVSVPVTVAGTMTLRPEGSGCVNDVQINVHCGIPLVGGKLADFVGGDTKKNMDAEYDYIKGQLG